MPKKKSKGKSSVAVAATIPTAAAAAASDGTRTVNESSYLLGEDLSLQRHDEETVLSAIYGEDFTATAGAWNCPLYKLRIRPAPSGAPPAAEVTANSCELTLTIQLNKKYPHSVPLIHLANTGNESSCFQITTTQISELLNLLQIKAVEFASLGQVMGWELGQVVEEYLVDCVEMRRIKEKDENDTMQRKKNNNNRIIENTEFDDADRGADDEWSNFDDYTRTDIINDDEHHSVAHSFTTPTEFDMMVDSDTQREVARQIEALDDAARMRRQRRQRGVLPSIADKNDDDGDDGNSDEEGYGYPDLTAVITPVEQQQLGVGGNFSRYQTDFVEIAHLGRGGGGEVVQAINRLDRRVYAIKKVLLEEESDATKWATMQNEKLRREVTTISMMAHKNIVRYYQAWVEYPTVVQNEKEEIMTSDNVRADNLDQDVNNADIEGDDSSSWASEQSSSTTSSSVSNSSSSASSSDSRTSLSNLATITDKSVSQLSLENFLEHEVGITDFSNPLLGNGTMFGYPPILTSPSSNPSSSQAEQLQHLQSYSTSERANAKNSGIMYIQMQYCKTTMRDMIDKSKLSIDTVWKSLRQILEALVYIHGRNVIHRDLKPAK